MPLKVLVLTTTFPAVPGDGTPGFVLDLSESLAQSFDITVVAPRIKRAPLRESIGNLEVIRFRSLPARWESLADGAILANLRSQPFRILELPSFLGAFMWTSLRAARRLRPDVVHAHWILPAGLVAFLIKKILGIPYVLTCHGADAHSLRGSYFRWLKSKILGESHLVSPVSREIASMLGSELERNVVPMGVDFKRLREVMGKRTPKPGRFLFVGRLVDKKGIDVLIDAMSLVPEATLDVVGDGPDRRRLEALAGQKGVAGRIRFLGSQPRRLVMEALRSAGALVIPSRVGAGGDSEGTPVVLAEGVAAGVPVIASDLGGLSEHLTHRRTGLLVESRSSQDLAEALREAIRDPGMMEQMASTARKELAASLDLREASQRYESFITTAALAPR